MFRLLLYMVGGVAVAHLMESLLFSTAIRVQSSGLDAFVCDASGWLWVVDIITCVLLHSVHEGG